MNTAKKKMLSKLAEKHAIGGPPEGDEFTIADWQEVTGLSNSHANNQLGKMVSNGELTMRTGRINHRRRKIYKPV